MSYKQELLNNANNTPLSYVGAAMLGIVLNTMFHMVTGGQILLGVGLYVAYMVLITYIDRMCSKDIKWACEFNELWITLEELMNRKLQK